MPTEMLLIMLDVLEILQRYRPIPEQQRWARGMWTVVAEFYGDAGGCVSEPEDWEEFGCMFCAQCEPILEPNPERVMALWN